MVSIKSRFIISSFVLHQLILLGQANDDVKQNVGDECICDLKPRPYFFQKEKVARWMVHSLDWGTLSTISTRLQATIIKSEDGKEQTKIEHVDESESNDPNSEAKKMIPVPFGNTYSFVDGSCSQSTGTPYFYMSHMDQTFQDILKNRAVSLTLSENAIPSMCGGSPLDSCTVSHYSDPESPVCARLVLTGALVIVDSKAEEYDTAIHALFQRHPSMAKWPKDHGWVVAKLDIQDIWFIDMFGGASILDVDSYKGIVLDDVDNHAIESGQTF